MQFEESKSILLTEGPQRKIWRTGVDQQPAIRIQTPHKPDIVSQHPRQIIAHPQATDSILVLSQFCRISGIQRIGTGPRMRIDIPERFFFLPEILSQLNENEVFEDVGVVAGMKGVAITQHD